MHFCYLDNTSQTSESENGGAAKKSPRHRRFVKISPAPPHEKKLLIGDFFPKFFKRQGLTRTAVYRHKIRYIKYIQSMSKYKN
jgi:hypothetical protein